MTVNPFPLQLKLLRKATSLSGPRGPSVRLLNDAQHQEIRGMMTDSNGRMTLDGLNSSAGRESLDRLATVHGNMRALVSRGMLLPIQTTHTQHVDTIGSPNNPSSAINQSTVAKIHQTDGYSHQLADKGVTFAGLVSTGGPISPRPFVMVRHVEHDGTVHHLPFYNSTGQAEKEETQTGEWYYTPGIQHLDNTSSFTNSNHGWIGKIGGKDMLETSQIPIIKHYKSILDAHLGDLTGNNGLDHATIPMMFDGMKQKTNIPTTLMSGRVLPYSFEDIVDPTGQDPRRLGHTFAAISRLTSTAPLVQQNGGISELLRDLKVNGATEGNLALWEEQKKHLGTLTPPKA